MSLNTGSVKHEICGNFGAYLWPSLPASAIVSDVFMSMKTYLISIAFSLYSMPLTGHRFRWYRVTAPAAKNVCYPGWTGPHGDFAWFDSTSAERVNAEAARHSRKRPLLSVNEYSQYETVSPTFASIWGPIFETLTAKTALKAGRRLGRDYNEMLMTHVPLLIERFFTAMLPVPTSHLFLIQSIGQPSISHGSLFPSFPYPIWGARYIHQWRMVQFFEIVFSCKRACLLGANEILYATATAFLSVGGEQT